MLPKYQQIKQFLRFYLPFDVICVDKNKIKREGKNEIKCVKQATFFLAWLGLQIKINQRDLFDYSIEFWTKQKRTFVHLKLNVERVDFCHINHRLSDEMQRKTIIFWFLR